MEEAAWAKAAIVMVRGGRDCGHGRDDDDDYDDNGGDDDIYIFIYIYIYMYVCIYGVCVCADKCLSMHLPASSVVW